MNIIFLAGKGTEGERDVPESNSSRKEQGRSPYCPASGLKALQYHHDAVRYTSMRMGESKTASLNCTSSSVLPHQDQGLYYTLRGSAPLNQPRHEITTRQKRLGHCGIRVKGKILVLSSLLLLPKDTNTEKQARESERCKDGERGSKKAAGGSI